jgi:hypothetical protein
MSKIFCPCCETELKVTHRDRYQDLNEHVSNPNGEPSMKDGYQCTNEDCIANQCNVSWIEDGDCYLGKRPEEISYSILSFALKAKTGHSFAINSWNYHYQLGMDAIKKRTVRINLYWYKINFIPKEKGWDYPIEKRHHPNMWKWGIEIWKKTSEHGYTNVIPFWRMMRFSIGQFKMNYRNWKENGSDRSGKDAFDLLIGISSWGHIDTRFYSRMSRLWIKLFHPGKVKELIQEYKK